MDLTQIESHFAFGQNWASYADKIGEREIQQAIMGLRRLVGDRLVGRRFLDIGCGSGLHSLAALRLGAAAVTCLDYDPESVATARAVLAKHASGYRYDVKTASVFEISPTDWGQFDVVYSWGVLHHTGDMDRALRSAAALVAPQGKFVFALYRKTWLCGLWKLEKRWYKGAPARMQRLVRSAYAAVFALGLALTGRSFRAYVRDYGGVRGMDYYHDIHDWLGGYPYESISPQRVDQLMDELGLHQERAFIRKGRVFGRDVGIFGSGCDEFVYARSGARVSPPC
jgi:2-polyprenyl-6-hydroxyphenyl methylase/3-demethylubiquinone-9 3-methyltransferase